MNKDSLIDIWIKGRFGYALPALKIVLGNLITMLILNWYDPSILQRQIIFPEIMTYGHLLGYLTGASGIIIASYYAGEFWINLVLWIIRKIATKEDADAK